MGISKKLFGVFAVALILSALICGCLSKDIVITFVTNGGNEISAATFGKDENIAMPEEPVREGYVFAGWFLDEGLTQPLKEVSSIKESLTLYVKWEELTPPTVVTPTSLITLWQAANADFKKVWGIDAECMTADAYYERLLLIHSPSIHFFEMNFENIVFYGNTVLCAEVNLDRITVDEAITTLYYIYNGIEKFTSYNGKTICGEALSVSCFLDGGVKQIGDGYFSADGKTYIAYGGQSETFRVPAGIEKIGGGAVCNRNIKAIDFSENDTLTEIASLAFAENDLEELIIPFGVQTLGGGAFRKNFLKMCAISANVLEAGYWAFHGNPYPLVLYCEADSQPAGFDHDWNQNNMDAYTVIWGADLSVERVYHFVTEGTRIENVQGICVIDEPISSKENKALAGWYISADGNEAPVSFPYYQEALEVTLFARFADYTPGLSFEYSSQEDGYEVTGYDGIRSEVFIPEFYNDEPVVGVAALAFLNSSVVKSITGGVSLRYLGEGSFSSCDELVTVILPDSLEEIGTEAFAGCRNLHSIIIPYSVEVMGYCVFDSTMKFIYCERSEDECKYHNSWIASSVKTTVIYNSDGRTRTYHFVTNDERFAKPDVDCLNVQEIRLELDAHEVVWWYDNPALIGDPVVFPYFSTEKTTLYARWQTICFVTFRAQPNAAEETKTVFSGENAVIPTYNIQGHIVEEWYLNEALTASAEESLSLPIVSDLVVYAKWKRAPLTIAFDTRNGNAMEPIYLYPGDVIPTLSEPYRAGSDFLGWYDNEELTGDPICLGSVTVQNDTVFYAKWTELSYFLDGSGYTVTGIGNITGGSVVVPAVYNGLPVTSIDNAAFAESIQIIELILGENIVSVGQNACYSCQNLVSLTVSSSVTLIGADAFCSCANLIHANFAESDKPLSIEARAFFGTGLLSIVLPDRTILLGASVFYGCVSMISADLGEGITEISSDAFNSCASLVSVIIGANVTTIGVSAFYGCVSLGIFTLPEGLLEIQNFAFARGVSASTTTRFSEINLPDSLISIGDYAFNSNDILNNVYFGASLQTIGDRAFQHCSISEVLLYSVKTIGIEAFFNRIIIANTPSRVVIGVSVESIGASAFGCYSAVSILADNPPLIGENAFDSMQVYVPTGSVASYQALGSATSASGFRDCGFHALLQISFISNGGASVHTITDIAYGDTVEEPAHPSKDGCIFERWYNNPELTDPYFFVQEVTDDLILYAKWI